MTTHISVIARFAVGLLVMTGVLMGCILTAPSSGDLFETSDIDVEGQAAREALETLWGAPLPESASDFHYYAYGFQDVIGFGRFRVSAADWESLFPSPKVCVSETFDAEIPIGFYNNQIDKGWWTPEDATQVLGSEQCQGANGVFYNVMADVSDANTYIVYVYAFTT